MDGKYVELSDEIAGLKRQSDWFNERCNKFTSQTVKYEESISLKLNEIRKDQAESERKLCDELKRSRAEVICSGRDYLSDIQVAVNTLEPKLCQALNKEVAECGREHSGAQALSGTQQRSCRMIHQETLNHQSTLKKRQDNLAESLQGLKSLIKDFIEDSREVLNGQEAIKQDLAYELVKDGMMKCTVVDPHPCLIPAENNAAYTTSYESSLDFTVSTSDIAKPRYAVGAVIMILIAIAVCISLEESEDYLYCRRLPRGRDPNILAFMDTL
ncbi:hypothetical protein M422DRAFT_54043 [Sphaerobolus stellatus SS14]|uniref:Uncharacterized protein n=1 Tax=Sphaerobolus stellatus (strain SS14) TaxID=990650 RepID=A0A0C9ULI0_SPHS4|nr:hypothetical protein M422DRAFT_54043 [Sphaerobolus stellatus SS14]